MESIFLSFFEGPFAPWVPGFVLVILLGTAVWDARTGIVPNTPILIGAIAVAAARFFEKGWEDAALYIGMGFATWVSIYLINEAWYRVFKKDAVGMGDAKWTALAVATFGPMPGMFAWFAGSWVSLIWIGLCYAIGQRIKKVYFAPFLFCGLLIGLAVTRHIIQLPFPLLF